MNALTSFQSAELKQYSVSLNVFVETFGDGLLDSLNRSTPAIY